MTTKTKIKRQKR